MRLLQADANLVSAAATAGLVVMNKCTTGEQSPEAERDSLGVISRENYGKRLLIWRATTS